MADRLTIEHYVGEAFVKCGQVILGSRILPSGGTTKARPARDKRSRQWFQLELEDEEGVRKEVEQWRKDISVPLVVEILMGPGGTARGASTAGANPASAPGAAGVDGSSPLPGEMLLERWTLQYERGSFAGGAGSGTSSSMAGAAGAAGTRTYLDEVSVYKRLTILVRSLYSYTRVLPAFKLFRAAKQRGRSDPSGAVALQHRILRLLQPQGSASASLGCGIHPSPPQPRLQDFIFAPVDTPSGRFRVAVQYNPAAAALVLEYSAAPVAMPYTINENYLGPGGALAGGASRGHPLYGAPGTSAPTTGCVAGPSRSTMSASAYGGSHVTGRSPPPDGGILRHAPYAGSVGAAVYGAPTAGGHMGTPATTVPVAAPPRVIVRQSWSSKEMKVSFSLPPPLGSPGGAALGGPTVFRRSSSGYGSTPSTPPLSSPVTAARPAGHHPGGGSSGGTSASSHGPHHAHHHHYRQHPNPVHPAYHRTGSTGSSNLGTTPPSVMSPTGPPPPPRPPVAPSAKMAVAISASGIQTAAAAAATAAISASDGCPAAGSSSDVVRGTAPVSIGCPASSAFAAPALQQDPLAPPASTIQQERQQHGDGAGAAFGAGAASGRAGVGTVGRQGDAEGGAAGAEGPSSGTADRTTSAPVAIPARSSSRTRSVNDLRGPAVYGGFEVHPAVAAAAASSRTAAAAAAAAAAAGSLTGRDASADAAAIGAAAAAAEAAAAHHRMAPGSAPAAPRGMLGLALGALKPGGSGGAASSIPCDGTSVREGGQVQESGVASGGTSSAQLPASGQHSTVPESGSAARPAGRQPSQALAVVLPSPRDHHIHHHRQTSVPYGSGGAGPAGTSPGQRVPIGSLPPYGSPQLPFAFTPSVQSMSLASLHQAMVPLGYFGGHGDGGPSGGGPRAIVSGRDITSLATIRRPSWTSRSGSLDPSLASVGAAGALMPSLSPLHDMLESSSFSNASTPGATPSQAATPTQSGRRSGGHTAPDSQGHTRKHGQALHSGSQPRQPSSSSASAIFSLSPTSAVAGLSPSPSARRSGGKGAAAAAAAAAAMEGRGGGEGGPAPGGIAGAAGVPHGGLNGSSGTAADELPAGRLQAVAGSLTAAAYEDADGAAAAGGGSGDPAPPASSGAAVAAAAITAAATAVAAAGAGASPTSMYDMYGPYGDPEADGGLCPLAREDSESDLLPFALDQEGLLLGPVGGPGALAGRTDSAGRPLHPAAGPIELTLSIAQARERDVAVGAFIRMMAEAAPLAAPPGHPAARELSGREALTELESMGRQIREALAWMAA